MIVRNYTCFFIISVLYAACNYSSANLDLHNEKEVRKTLATTWEAEYFETSGVRNKVPENMVTHFTINKNGTYSSGVKNGMIKQKGTWSYDPKTEMLIKGRGNEISSSRILKLTQKELVTAEYMIFNDEIVDSTVVTYKKL